MFGMSFFIWSIYDQIGTPYTPKNERIDPLNGKYIFRPLIFGGHFFEYCYRYCCCACCAMVGSNYQIARRPIHPSNQGHIQAQMKGLIKLMIGQWNVVIDRSFSAKPSSKSELFISGQTCGRFACQNSRSFPYIMISTITNTREKNTKNSIPSLPTKIEIPIHSPKLTLT